jgi:hypothetical protein
LEHRARPTGQSEWRLNVRASYGEQDYTSLSQQFQTQPTLPLSTTLFMVDGSAGLRWRASRRTALSLALGAAYRRTLNTQDRDSQTAGGVYVMPAQTTVSAAPAWRYALSPRSTLELSVPVFDYDIQAGSSDVAQGARINVVTFQPQVGLADQVARDHQVRLVAGITYAEELRGGAAVTGNRVSPLGQLSVNSVLYRDLSTAVRSGASAGVTWFLDPVLGDGRWRAVATVELSAQMGSRWSAGTRSSFVTDISRPPPAATPVDETMFSADCSLRYVWPRAASVELGGRFSERAPSLASSEFAWHGRELWAFLSVYAATRVPLSGVRLGQRTVGM